jgi:hypothetical protein
MSIVTPKTTTSFTSIIPTNKPGLFERLSISGVMIFLFLVSD